MATSEAMENYRACLLLHALLRASEAQLVACCAVVIWCWAREVLSYETGLLLLCIFKLIAPGKFGLLFFQDYISQKLALNGVRSEVF